MNQTMITMAVEFERNGRKATLIFEVPADTYWDVSERGATQQSDRPWLSYASLFFNLPEIREGRIVPVPTA